MEVEVQPMRGGEVRQTRRSQDCSERRPRLVRRHELHRLRIWLEIPEGDPTGEMPRLWLQVGTGGSFILTWWSIASEGEAWLTTSTAS
jgi:hypothetical protein